MNIEFFREYCLSKADVTESMPFDDKILVFNIEAENFTVNLKCDPSRAVELRERYPEVQPGYHMHKKHWNTVNFEGSLSKSFLLELVDYSYDLVVKGLPKKVQAALRAREKE